VWKSGKSKERWGRGVRAHAALYSCEEREELAVARAQAFVQLGGHDIHEVSTHASCNQRRNPGRDPHPHPYTSEGIHRTSK
jgi:hypothetical protein